MGGGTTQNQGGQKKGMATKKKKKKKRKAAFRELGQTRGPPDKLGEKKKSGRKRKVYMGPKNPQDLVQKKEKKEKVTINCRHKPFFRKRGKKLPGHSQTRGEKREIRGVGGFEGGGGGGGQKKQEHTHTKQKQKKSETQKDQTQSSGSEVVFKIGHTSVKEGHKRAVEKTTKKLTPTKGGRDGQKKKTPPMCWGGMKKNFFGLQPEVGTRKKCHNKGGGQKNWGRTGEAQHSVRARGKI